MTCPVTRPERRRELSQILASQNGAYIARGLGRSYGDQALNTDGGVILMTRLNRMLSFDETTGVLVCEAGVTLAEIIEVFLPRGYFLWVTPGTKFVTVGGAIANDVHGKNHHVDGSFASCTLGFTLELPSGEVVECSREVNPEVFWATLGGAGLTGVVVMAAIRLRRVNSAWMRVDYRKLTDLDATLSALDAFDAHHTYSVAWVDTLARGGSLGRSISMHGDHLDAERLPASIRNPLSSPGNRQWVVPFELPVSGLNRWSVGAFNELFWLSHRTQMGRFVPLEPYFYPLDRVHHWNRLYGARGFVQYQVAFPRSQGPAALQRLLERLSVARAASFLAVIKRFGAGNSGLLSFPLEGFTLALDLPWHPSLPAFLRELDALTLAYGGRIYFAKDACADASTVAMMYPRLNEFVALKARLDPEQRLASILGRRVGLC
ncbi:MAG: FAD-binding oxidoreductase [Candidatus Sericytochromatia bacterium]|nr:FAD-binding oxidoreductase [Candidatus Sericytochromatia bacterium]